MNSNPWANRYQAVRDNYWWRIKTGNGTRLVGKYHTKRGAETAAAEMLTAFLDGKFVGEKEVGVDLLREKAEKRADKIHALRASIGRILNMAITIGYDAGHAGIEAECREALDIKPDSDYIAQARRVTFFFNHTRCEHCQRFAFAHNPQTMECHPTPRSI